MGFSRVHHVEYDALAVSDWTLQNAMPLIREIAPIARRCGFLVALYGSVLETGCSPKYLDLVLVVQEPDIADPRIFLKELAELPIIHHVGDLSEGLRRRRTAVVCLHNGRHIDLQFVNVGGH